MVFRVLTIDEGTSREDIEARALDAFDFLITTAQKPPALERASERSRFQFVLDQIFVELELDWQESALFVLVGGLVNGETPSGYYMDATGRRARWHLGAVLKEGGHYDRVEKLRLLTAKSGAQAMVDQIEGFAAELALSLHELPSLIQDLRSA